MRREKALYSREGVRMLFKECFTKVLEMCRVSGSQDQDLIPKTDLSFKWQNSLLTTMWKTVRGNSIADSRLRFLTKTKGFKTEISINAFVTLSVIE